MRTSFHPKLINPPLSDPGLFIPFPHERRAILFDLGDLQGLSSRDLLKISHVFVTHTHMDHFVGFDHLLRIFLGREKELHLYGPPEFFSQIEGKLAGYTWNLVDEYEHPLKLNVTEVHDGRTRTRSYLCQDRFRPEREMQDLPFAGLILTEPSFTIEGTLLDHRIPCLGLSLTERFSVNIHRERLQEMDLPVGPWLTRFKKALYAKEAADAPFAVTWEQGGRTIRERTFALGELSKLIAIISPGQKITYITDIIGSPENLEKAVMLARGADHLFIEAGFLEKDKETARRKHHLTAREAGLVARRAGVKKFTPFHFSPRYGDRQDEILKEAMEAYGY
jgi:ribonuclease Z